MMNAKLQFKAYQDENMFSTVKQIHDHFNWWIRLDLRVLKKYQPF